MNVHSTAPNLFRFKSVISVSDERKHVINKLCATFAAEGMTQAATKCLSIASSHYPNGVYFTRCTIEQISRKPINELADVELVPVRTLY